MATSERADLARRTTVIILAGGFGTRVRHLLPDIPKPMAPVQGKPFVEWVVRFLAARGFERFVISTGYLAEKIEKHFAAQPVPGVRVSCRPETTPLGTAGGCLNCVPAGLSPDALWLVVNGDSLVVADPIELLEPLAGGEGEAALFGLEVADAGRYGSLAVGEAGRLVGFNEKRPGAGLINAGTYALTGGALRVCPAKRPLSFETDVFPRLAAEGSAVVVRTAAPFLDIGTPETLGQAEAFIRANQTQFL